MSLRKFHYLESMNMTYESCGTKNSFQYFIAYNDGDVIRPLYIILPQMIGYVNTLTVIRQCPLRLVIISY